MIPDIYVRSDGSRFYPEQTHMVSGVLYNGTIGEYPDALSTLGVSKVTIQMPEDYSEEEYSYHEIPVFPYAVYVQRTLSERVGVFEKHLDAHLDSVAKEYRYDTRFTFALRSGYPNLWRDEATNFAIWMDTCNALAYQHLLGVFEGTKEMPASREALIALLPPFINN